MGRRWRRDLHRVGTAAAQALAHDGLEVLVEAGFDGGEMVAAATEQDAPSWELRVRLREEVKNRVGCQADLVIDVFELRWNFKRVKSLMLHGEEATWTNTGAGAVLGPLVLQEREVRCDVEVLREICRGRLFAAKDGIGAVVVLRPEAVQDEARPRGAFWRSTPDGAKLR